MYDPDVTFGGHQPYYFDRYAALYNYYTVLGSRIVYKLSVDTSSTQGVICGLYAYKDNAVPNTGAGLQEIMESKYGKYRMFINTPVQSFTLSMAQRSTTMLQTSESQLINSTNFRTLTSSSPSSEWYY